MLRIHAHGESGGMIQFNIRDNFPEVKRQLDTMRDDLANKVVWRALNKTVDQGRTEMARQISREFMLTSAQVKERLEVVRSRRDNLGLSVMLWASNKRKARSMNLIAFVEKKISLAEANRRLKRGTLQQLRFQIKRKGGKKTIPGAFIANQGRTVFIREGKARLPIEALGTIDVPQMFNTKRINSVVRKVMLAKFEANFEREARAVLLGYAK